MAAEFLAQLPTVTVESLPPGSECPICSDVYSTELTENGAVDSPVRLPCNHIFGGECIRHWLSPGKSGANGCPLCRRQFFTQIPNVQDNPDIDDVHDADLTAESREEALQRLRLEVQATVELREYARNLNTARRTRPSREWTLYLRLAAAYGSFQ